MILKLILLFALTCIAVTTGTVVEKSDPGLVTKFKTIADNPKIDSFITILNNGKLISVFPSDDLPSNLDPIVEISEVYDILVISDIYKTSADSLAKIEKSVVLHGQQPIFIILTQPKTGTNAVGGVVGNVVGNKCSIENPAGCLQKGLGALSVVIPTYKKLGIMDTFCGVTDLPITHEILNDILG